eukprot:14623827-Ditylum_brightwellii.AAC.1
MKLFLKRTIVCADERENRSTNDVNKKQKHKAQRKKRKDTVIESPGNTLPSGLLAEINKEAKEKNCRVDDMLSTKGSNGGSSLYSGVIRYTYNDESSTDGIKPDIKYYAFANNDSEYAEDMMKVDNF